MVSSRQLLSLALALCSCHPSSAFAGIVTTRGGGVPSPAATPPRAIDGVEQQLGVIRRARGGALLRRRGVAVPAPDQGGLVVESGDKNGSDGLLASYLRALDTKPIITKVITSGVICGIGDIMAQALAFKTAATESFSLGSFLAALEFKRLAIYGVLGALWIAPVVHYWFDGLDAVFKDKKAVPGAPPPSLIKRTFKIFNMVALDQIIGAPLVNAGFMFLFTFATALTSGTGGIESGKKAGTMVKNGIWSTMLVCWKLWPIANTINFAFVPTKLRVLFMNFVGLGWNIYLSAAVN
ncbi:unnamed protein product [Ectocarpus sp. 4 AP-2014]